MAQTIAKPALTSPRDSPPAPQNKSTTVGCCGFKILHRGRALHTTSGRSKSKDDHGNLVWANYTRWSHTSQCVGRPLKRAGAAPQSPVDSQ